MRLPIATNKEPIIYIKIKIENRDLIDSAINRNLKYICSETLADSLELVENLGPEEALAVEVEEGLETLITIDKVRS